jgi:uncharacterized membrane protein
VASAVLAAGGAAISPYLVYVRETGAALACTTGGCETVQGSDYALIAGVPVAAIGLVGFVGLFAAAILPGQVARLAQATISLAALTFSAYLLFVQLHASGRSVTGASSSTA